MKQCDHKLGSRQGSDRRLLGAMLLDFSAAFDVIDHYLLLGKLKCHGFNFTALSWMESYLSERRQRVSMWGPSL